MRGRSLRQSVTVIARVLLRLALTKTKDVKEIQRMFDEY
jgi:L-asparaginase/Glu-tRNA(Gln) amidotransferase subunit D